MIPQNTGLNDYKVEIWEIFSILIKGCFRETSLQIPQNNIIPFLSGREAPEYLDICLTCDGQISNLTRDHPAKCLELTKLSQEAPS